MTPFMSALSTASRAGFAATIVLSALPARADHCAPLALAPAREQRLSARLDFETARYARPQVAGSWWGLATELGAGGSRWQTRGWVGVYQLDHNGTIEKGPGDAGLELRLTALRGGHQDGADAVDLHAEAEADIDIDNASQLSWQMGPTLAVTLPTAPAATGLGMGHAMVMPGVWWSLPGLRVRAGGTVVYGRALATAGGGGHQHGAGPGPLLDPMNSSELMASTGIDVRLWAAAGLRALVTASYAHPLVEHGAARGAGGIGLGATLGPLHLASTVQLPLVGDAFEVRVITSATIEM
jgi:hypothetical protein